MLHRKEHKQVDQGDGFLLTVLGIPSSNLTQNRDDIPRVYPTLDMDNI